MAARRDLTLAEKVELIRKNEQNVPYRKLAGEYKISIGSVSNIVKRKVEYIENYEQNENSNKKRNLRDEFSQQLDQKVYEWFVQQRSKNIPISGPLLQEQARQIRQQLGGSNADDFKASNGWLEKFRKRHGIQYRTINGESASVDPATVDEWKKRLVVMIDKYNPNDIYNADETGLFFKALPNRSLVTAKDSCKGGKRSKERFTVLLCTNMTGTDKLKPLMIGQHLVKHVISRCALATSPDDIIITALDAVTWTKNAWESVTQLTIRNTFRMAGFVHPNTQDTISGTIDNENDTNEETIIDDITTALKDLDTLLAHIHIDGQSLSASEFVEMDLDTPTFNEWNESDNDVIIVDEEYVNKKHNNNDQDDDILTEAPPKLIDAMEMAKKLHLLASTQYPELHSLISQLDSQLTQLFIDSKGAKQTKIDDFFCKN
ncbi:unnamed protein product [Rotaria sordida]|uniref:HTH CENPB-type domain-containing protein n=1 Tax=Rotaria sordida TaxID=392033 RepID=A0A816DDG5_9BILA|nr:unnamed protein product [Rotaria sordida]CAF1432029.1 unnamed protein product [Rotaria sordida]CAF1632959.1 unnamed protein product [Rotaria sordida]CAF2569849.1 unnamed protein product [Rotaria sp. Silwood2]CAF3916865.1 unnamed protein product [Rotaria sordida]